jgi:hypothetical protein
LPSPITRRRFFGRVSRAAACAAIGVSASEAVRLWLHSSASAGTASAEGRAPFSLASATHETFAALVGTTFRITTPAGDTCDAVLARVTRAPDKTGHRPAAFREPFTLRFIAARGGSPRQATCDLRHDRLGSLQLYLVSTPGGAGGHVYDAVFG